MRVAFTILLNGFEHMHHNNYYSFLQENFDLWVIAEGVAKNNGSTSWCNIPTTSFHKNFLSIDGSTEFLDELEKKYNNIKIVRSNQQFWNSKDEQVNACIQEILKHTNNSMLWQIDIDEQWTLEKIIQAEKELKEKKGKTGCFLSNYFIGPNQQVFGVWGEGIKTPYRRLWDWNGEEFLTHEPPTLKGKNGPGFLLTPRFNHYAYYFKNDVKFKQLYYKGYEGLLERWENIQCNRTTKHIKEFLGPNIWWSNTETYIQYTNAR